MKVIKGYFYLSAFGVSGHHRVTYFPIKGTGSWSTRSGFQDGSVGPGRVQGSPGAPRVRPAAVAGSGGASQSARLPALPPCRAAHSRPRSLPPRAAHSARRRGESACAHPSAAPPRTSSSAGRAARSAAGCAHSTRDRARGLALGPPEPSAEQAALRSAKGLRAGSLGVGCGLIFRCGSPSCSLPCHASSFAGSWTSVLACFLG